MEMNYICPQCDEMIKPSLRAASVNVKRKCPVCGSPIDQDEVLRQRKLDRQVMLEQMAAEEAQEAIDAAKRRRKAAIWKAMQIMYAVVKYSLYGIIFWFIYMFWQVAGWPNPFSWGK